MQGESFFPPSRFAAIYILMYWENDLKVLLEDGVSGCITILIEQRINQNSSILYHRVWDQCNVVQDYLTVYDGGSTSDRVLVRLCGGDAVPDIVGSRDTMLLEFHTSPYDNPFHPVPLSFLPGFELEVQVSIIYNGTPTTAATSAPFLTLSLYSVCD